MRSPVIALLGPTNTGKTFHAVERMLEHRSGMIGFPLRLLARENYDRLVERVGRDAVALVTGEERVTPRSAALLPLHGRGDAGLAAGRLPGRRRDPALRRPRARPRLHRPPAARARPLRDDAHGRRHRADLVRRLVPEAAFIARPRLSTLRYVEPKKLDRLPRRSAVVVFSVADVYAVAERLRREGRRRRRRLRRALAAHAQRAGRALPGGRGRPPGRDRRDRHGPQPRHRARRRSPASSKFDGREPRAALDPRRSRRSPAARAATPADGTFGATTELGDFPPDLVAAIESHRFRPLERFYWRASDLDFASLDALARSLGRAAAQRRLRSARRRRTTSARWRCSRAIPRCAALARAPEHVALLWEVCQVPDFRNVLTDAHTCLLGRIFRHLRGPAARLPEDWVAAQVPALDRTDGDTRTRCSAASRPSAPGRTSRTATAWMARRARTGRSGRASSRTASRTRCTSG